jgi:hypothetical protein
VGRPASAETTRTLRIEIPVSSGPFAIENLAGAMRVVSGEGDTVVAVATVHAEDEETAGAFRFERAGGEAGAAVYRVRYPYDESKTFRYPGIEDGPAWLRLFGGSSTSTTYDGRKVRVSGKSGTLAYADVEVRVPRHELSAAFRNSVGRLEAQGLSGKLSFEAGSGDLTLERLAGSIQVEAGSGDARAVAIEGSFRIETGSGDSVLESFRGDAVSFEAGSGTIRMSSVEAQRVRAEAGSGDIVARELDAEDLAASTGSGDVELEVRGGRAARIRVETGSGDVTLRLGRDASFEARADQGSGDLVSGYDDAQPVVKGEDVIGYRRGADPRTRIEVETGSGDLTIEPGS